MSDVRITLHPNRLGTIEVDGVDMSRAVTGISLTHTPRDMAELDLEIAAHAVRIEGEASVRLYLPDGVREALIERGWTPPTDTA